MLVYELEKKLMIKKFFYGYLFLFVTIGSSQAHAYIGPGAGVGVALGAIMLLAGVFFLLLALIWFPLKRKIRSKKKKFHLDDD